MSEKTNENMFRNTLNKFKDMNLFQKVIIGILITIGSAIIIGLFVMATKVYSFEVEMNDVKQDMKEKATKEYVDTKIENVDNNVEVNGNTIKAIKEEDIKEIKDGIKELSNKFDEKTTRIENKIDENQKFIIEYIEKKH